MQLALCVARGKLNGTGVIKRFFPGTTNLPIIILSILTPEKRIVLTRTIARSGLVVPLLKVSVFFIIFSWYYYYMNIKQILYILQCPEGYTLTPDGKNCRDIIECEEVIENYKHK